MTIRVLSFDFDGCLFNESYIFAKNDDKDVIKYNADFFQLIKADSSRYSKSITFVGSNRQSKAIDDGNSVVFDRSVGVLRRKGSCFPAIHTINIHLEAKLDTFLLADIHGELPDGASYDRAMDENYTGDHAHWWFDEHKATILYAQIHRVAKENPFEAIEFSFFDDRQDILYSLNKFYSDHPSLIPANVTLSLHNYAGKMVTPIATLKGTGMIDSNYKETVKEMWAITRVSSMIPENARMANTAIRVDRHVTPTMLTQRIQLQAEEAEEIVVVEKAMSEIIDQNEHSAEDAPIQQHDADANLAGALSVEEEVRTFFCDTLFEFGKKAKSETGRYPAASKLYWTLVDAYPDYAENEISQSDFRTICETEMLTARPELEQHDDWKQLLANLDAAIVGLNIGYIVAGCIDADADVTDVVEVSPGVDFTTFRATHPDLFEGHIFIPRAECESVAKRFSFFNPSSKPTSLSERQQHTIDNKAPKA
jgi:hypothetical protein